MSYLMYEQNFGTELQMMGFIADLNVRPDEEAFRAIYSTYNDLFKLTGFKDRKIRNTDQKNGKSTEKKKGHGISRIMYGTIKILYDVVKTGEDKVFKQFNEVFDKKGDRIFHKIQEKQNDLKNNSFDTDESMIRLLKDSYRRNMERRRRNLKVLFELSNHKNFYDDNLYDYIFDFGEIYFMIGYCLRKDADRFFELINVSEKRDEFLQQYKITGKNFIHNMRILMNEQIEIESKQKTKSLQSGEMNTSEVNEEVEQSESESADNREFSTDLHQPHNSLLNLNLPVVTKYKLVTAYDIHSELLMNVPLVTADTIEIEDVEVWIDKRYLLSYTNPIGLSFIDRLEEEGSIVGVVVVRDIFNTYHIFTAAEEKEEFATEVAYHKVDSVDEFFKYFDTLINQYELPLEEELEIANEKDVYLSTVTDVLTALERLIR